MGLCVLRANLAAWGLLTVLSVRLQAFQPLAPVSARPPEKQSVQSHKAHFENNLNLELWAHIEGCQHSSGHVTPLTGEVLMPGFYFAAWTAELPK